MINAILDAVPLSLLEVHCLHFSLSKNEARVAEPSVDICQNILCDHITKAAYSQFCPCVCSLRGCIQCQATKIAPVAFSRVVAASQVTYREPQVSYLWRSIWHTKEMKHVSLNHQQVCQNILCDHITKSTYSQFCPCVCLLRGCIQCQAINIAPAAFSRVVAASQVTYREPQVSYWWRSIWHTKESVDNASVLCIDTDLERDGIYCEPPSLLPPHQTPFG